MEYSLKECEEVLFSLTFINFAIENKLRKSMNWAEERKGGKV